MRHSSKHGWVAKAYPDLQSSSSQPNLEDFSTNKLESESLDSFFDDDFEVEDLGNLLACNTLGVEKKALPILNYYKTIIIDCNFFPPAGHEKGLGVRRH